MFAGGAFTNKAGAILNADSSGSFTGTGTLTNQATLRHTTPGTVTITGLTLNNPGLITLTQGTVALTPGGGTFTNTGALSVAARYCKSPAT